MKTEKAELNKAYRFAPPMKNMNDNLKTFSLLVIAASLFTMSIIQVLDLVNQYRANNYSETIYPPDQTNPINQNSNSLYPHGVPLASENSNNKITKQPTTIVYKEYTHDFGTIKQGDVVNYKFTFTNTGKNPLIISNAQGSCGCTVPTYPKEPIAPGADAVIDVQFNSAGKVGEQNKTVTITANTEPPATVISIHANVKLK